MVKATTWQPYSSFKVSAASTAFRSSGFIIVFMEPRSKVPSGFTETLPDVSGTCFTVTNIFIILRIVLLPNDLKHFLK